MNKHSGLKFGYSHGLQAGEIPPAVEFLSLAEEVERAGFDSLWIDDHIAFRGNYLESLGVLSAFSARTERITLGSLVYLLPLRRPAIAAKAAATVDYLSGGGRFIFGIGVGGEDIKEFEICGVPKEERSARTDESIEILRKLWSGESVSHRGKFFHFADTRQSPPPATPGGPPIWVGGRSDASRRRAAILGDGYVPYLFSPLRYEKGLDQIRQWAAKAGRELEDSARPWTPALHMFVNFSEKEDAACEAGAENLSSRYGRDMREAARKYLLCGSLDKCAETIASFQRAGVRHFIFKVAAPVNEETEHMTRLAEEFLPLVRNQ